MKRLSLILLFALQCAAIFGATPNVVVTLPALKANALLDATVTMVPMQTATPTAALFLTLPTTAEGGGVCTFTNVPAGRYRLVMRNSGIADLRVIIPDTAGPVYAEQCVDPTENWTSPIPIIEAYINARGAKVLWPANALGALTNDSVGNLGYFDLSNLGGGGGESLFTNEAFYARLIGGSTNSLKVMTNGLMGIVIGDTNAANAIYGWPYAGLTFVNVLDGSSGHDFNTMLHGVYDASGSGASFVVDTLSQPSPRGTINLDIDVSAGGGGSVSILAATNGMAFSMGDGFANGYSNFVGFRSGSLSEFSTDHIGGTNMMRATWMGQDRFRVHTNGQASATTFRMIGSTNQVVFGATNIAPSSAVAPTKWISVEVQGDPGVYRLPLYE